LKSLFIYIKNIFILIYPIKIKGLFGIVVKLLFIYIKNLFILIHPIKKRFVWNCGSDDDSKYFLLRNTLKCYFFKKIILNISISKRSENIKKIIFKKN
jgi:hypothetical protein